jgi:hypothetical protein
LMVSFLHDIFPPMDSSLFLHSFRPFFSCLIREPHPQLHHWLCTPIKRLRRFHSLHVCRL